MDLTWTACPELGVEEARCATIEVARDRSDPARGTVGLAVARIPAASGPARGQLWFVDGGPGDSGRDDLKALRDLGRVVPDLEILTFDHRGVGGSGRLSCPVEEDPNSLDGAEIVGEEWRACVAHVAATYGDVLPSLTVAEAARDLVELTDRLAEPDQEVYWWGVSYGTRLVQRALAVAPDRPTGVVLDGVVPADWTFTEFDAGLDHTARRFLDACAADPACAARFDGHPAAVAEATLQAIPARCARLGIDADLARQLTGALHMPGEPYVSLVPSVWARLARCDRRDRKAFVHLFGALFPEDGEGGLRERADHSPVLQRHVAYADLWLRDGPDAAALEAAFQGYVSGTRVAANFASLAPDWPMVPPLDPAFGVAPATTVPILALHGGFDASLPVDRVRAGYEAWLVAPHQRFVVLPYAEHVTLNRGDCPVSLYRQFLADPTAELDTSCVAAMPPYAWDGEASFNEAMWGVPDRWGGGSSRGAPIPDGAAAPRAAGR